MAGYYGNIKRNPNDELEHWKYINRVRGKNGKWQYTYKLTGPVSKIGKTEESTSTHTYPSVRGSKQILKETVSKNYTKGLRNGMRLTPVSNSRITGNGNTIVRRKYKVTQTVGVLSRARASGEKAVYNLIYKKGSIGQKTVKTATRTISKGRKTVNEIFNRK